MVGWGYMFSYVIFQAESDSELRIAIFGLVLMIWPIYAFWLKLAHNIMVGLKAVSGVEFHGDSKYTSPVT